MVCGLMPAIAQQITGVWEGKIDRKKVEVKIILKGDSLTGTSYYYESPTNYRRYSIKGYFDAATNEAVWWDDQLLQEKTARSFLGAPGKIPMLARADFDCPGGGIMKLDGKAAIKEDGTPRGEVHLEKGSRTNFRDEWDEVIENYLVGGNDPDYINAVEQVALQHHKAPQAPAIVRNEPPTKPETKPAPKKDMVLIPPMPEKKEPPVAVIEPSIEEKFQFRKKELAIEIPLRGDSVELRFYDNAEIDGDSISLFLNNKLLFSHIRLLGSAYTLKLAVADLQAVNELIMVAENLGSIPPNTSYMVALVAGKRYEARLESTEGSSAMIRFIKTE